MKDKQSKYHSVDFTTETLTVKLSKPFYYKSVRDTEERLITKVVLSRLTSFEISGIRQFQMTMSDTADPMSRFHSLANKVLSYSVKGFIDQEGNDVDTASAAVLLKRTPAANIMKLLIFCVALTRQHGYLTSAYKHADCGKTTLFRHPVDSEKKPEDGSGEWYQEFLFDSVDEEVDVDGARSFTVELDGKYTLKGDATSEVFDLQMIEFTWPTLQDYLDLTNDSEKSSNIEPWALFRNIEKINDFDDKKLAIVKKANGMDILRLSTNDYSKITENLNRYGFWPTISDKECMHCGDTFPAMQDMTNFFEFLSRF